MDKSETISAMHSERSANGTEYFDLNVVKKLLEALQSVVGNGSQTLLLTKPRKDNGLTLYSYTEGPGIHKASGESPYLPQKRFDFGNYYVPEGYMRATIELGDSEKGSIFTPLFSLNGEIKYISRERHKVRGEFKIR